MDWKALLTSKTIWGLVVGIAAPILARHGVDLGDQDQLVVDVLSVIGLVLGVYGRITAQGPLKG